MQLQLLTLLRICLLRNWLLFLLPFFSLALSFSHSGVDFCLLFSFTLATKASKATDAGAPADRVLPSISTPFSYSLSLPLSSSITFSLFLPYSSSVTSLYPRT